MNQRPNGARKGDLETILPISLIHNGRKSGIKFADSPDVFAVDLVAVRFICCTQRSYCGCGNHPWTAYGMGYAENWRSPFCCAVPEPDIVICRAKSLEMVLVRDDSVQTARWIEDGPDSEHHSKRLGRGEESMRSRCSAPFAVGMVEIADSMGQDGAWVLLVCPFENVYRVRCVCDIVIDSDDCLGWKRLKSRDKLGERPNVLGEAKLNRVDTVVRKRPDFFRNIFKTVGKLFLPQPEHNTIFSFHLGNKGG